MISKNCDVLATMNGVLKMAPATGLKIQKLYSSTTVLFIADGGECAENCIVHIQHTQDPNVWNIIYKHSCTFHVL